MDNVKELKELFVFIFALIGGTVKTWEDKKVNIWDSLNFAPVVKAIKPAFDNLGNPLKRFADLTDEELAELCEWAANEFDIPNDTVEVLLEKSLKQAVSIVELANEWAALKKAS